MPIRTENDLSRILSVRIAAAETEPPEIVPHINPLSFNGFDRGAMFQVASSAWQDIFLPKTIVSLVTSNANPDTKRAGIKSVRKIGQGLRTGYKLFDKRHAVPQQFDNLLIELGTYNDMFHRTPTPNTQPLLSSIAEFSSGQMVFDFQPTSDESYQRTIAKRINNISEATKEDNLPAPTFHTMRRNIRHIMELFLLACVVTPSNDHFQMYSHLNELNHTLGQMQEDLVINDMRGIQPYESSIVILTDTTRRNITNTLAVMGFGS